MAEKLKKYTRMFTISFYTIKQKVITAIITERNKTQRDPKTSFFSFFSVCFLNKQKSKIIERLYMLCN